MKVLKIKENKDGSAIMDYTINKKDEVFLKKAAKIKGKKYSNKFVNQCILEGIERMVKEHKRGENMSNFKWVLKIEKIDNGYILEGKFGDSDVKSRRTIEEKLGDKLDELRAVQNLLWEIKEYFGVYGSKHNEHNLEIKIVDKEGKEIEND